MKRDELLDEGIDTITDRYVEVVDLLETMHFDERGELLRLADDVSKSQRLLNQYANVLAKRLELDVHPYELTTAAMLIVAKKSMEAVQ